MKQYIIKRLASMLLGWIGLTWMAFLLVRIMPGDPIEAYFQKNSIPITNETLTQLREDAGLNDSLFTQYITWIKGVPRFDLGTSFMTGNPVGEELSKHFFVTAQLALVAFLIILVVSIPLGILSSVKRGTQLDRFMNGVLFSLASVPSFWLGFILVYTFALKLDIFPLMGWGTVDMIVLPAITLASASIPYYIRMIRINMIEQMNQPYVMYARARGIHEFVILRKHLFKNTLTPLITSLAITLGVLIGGAAIVEIIFSIPGIGELIVDAVSARDYVILQGFILDIGTFYLIANVVADLLCAWIDPRIQLEE